MHAIILSAGRGGRMWPLSPTVPKSALPLAGETVLARLLGQATDAGAGRIEIVAPAGSGFFAGQAQAWSRARGVDVAVRPQPVAAGTGAALLAATRPADGALVLFGDVVLADATVRAVAGGLDEDVARMAVAHVPDVSPYAQVALDGDTVRSLHEKGGAGPGLANSGCFWIPAAMWRDLEGLTQSPRGELELTEALQRMAARGRLRAVRADSWRSIEWPWDLLGANEAVLADARVRLDGGVHSRCEVKGAVVVEPGARLESGVVVEGPAYVGRDAHIGPNAWIRPGTVVGAGARVGHGCEVKGSVLFAGARVNHLSYVGDSVLAAGASLGAGTMVANRRHDGEAVRALTPRGWVDTKRRKFGAVVGAGARTGINTSLNAGVLLPEGHATPPGATLLRSPLG